MTVDLSNLNVRTVPDDRLDATRHELRQQATDLVSRAGGDLTGDDVDTFNQIEQALGSLDQRARNNAFDMANAGSGLLATIAAATDTTSAPSPDTGNGPSGDGSRADNRRIGAIPRIAFGDSQLRELYAGAMERRSVSVTADAGPQTRAVTAPPMSAIPSYQLPPVPFGREPTRITALMPTTPIDHASAVFYQGTTGADAATAVAEGATKPESTPGWTAVTAPARKLAHFVDVSTEALADYGAFSGVVETEMTAGLRNVENLQVLSGNGVAPNLLGLLSTVGAQVYAPAAAEMRLKSILHAETLLRTGTSYVDEPDVVILNPSDWEKVQLTAATTGELLVSPTPTTETVDSLWGVPVVQTAQIAAGTALVASLKGGTVCFSRQPPMLMVDPYSQSSRNMVRIIAEERLAIGVTRPTALCVVTFNGSV